MKKTLATVPSCVTIRMFMHPFGSHIALWQLNFHPTRRIQGSGVAARAARMERLESDMCRNYSSAIKGRDKNVVLLPNGAILNASTLSTARSKRNS
jgi:hypothetical protein